MLRVGAGPHDHRERRDVALEELAERLKRMFAARDDHILFFDAADDVEYGFAVEVMDQAREGGAVTIAPLTAALSRPAPRRRLPLAILPRPISPPPEASDVGGTHARSACDAPRLPSHSVSRRDMSSRAARKRSICSPPSLVASGFGIGQRSVCVAKG